MSKGGAGASPSQAWSLRARLVASAAVFVLAAIVVVAFVLTAILNRTVRGEIASRLDLQISTIRSELLLPQPPPPGSPPRPGPPLGGDERVRIAGALAGGRLDAPPFDRRRSGWYWQVDGMDERGTFEPVAASRSLAGRALRLGDEEADRLAPGRGPPHRLEEAVGVAGERLLLRAANVELDGRPYRILASAPAGALRDPLRAAAAAVALTLFLLGLALVAAIVVQVRFGLQPLEALRRQLAAVRAGEVERIEGRQPSELSPLVAELNALIEQDAANLRQARLHVANLAHGLKTPLASLSAMVERQPADAGRTELLGLAELMDRRIRHHLRRAQTAALGSSTRRRTDLAVHVADLAAMSRRFHAGSPLSIKTQGPDTLFVAVDGEDCDEMLGNLLDNAIRHARARVALSYGRTENEAWIRVADDGPGLAEHEIAVVQQAGRRLDESEPGHGFGLPITREIAELYGGRLELGRADEGGLAACLRLPTASGTDPR
ncbi:HAMP domain-containing sensor histidine kinase [Aureimonas sp. AU22]|uniref:sensor histidine kinase n=1 Tax=Aureimonas sp. AU22 TaxID=1638162 RepID=UPI00078508F3|nr:HAMP domain-containing sensor histidine kinase [Aureimonas sp. AU22]